MCKASVGSLFRGIPVFKLGDNDRSEPSWKEWMTGLQKDFNCWNGEQKTVGSVGKSLPSCKAEANHEKGELGGHKGGLESRC